MTTATGDSKERQNRCVFIVPDSLLEIIQKQIEESTKSEQEVLAAASVVGHSFSAAVVAAGLGKNPSEIEECCDSLARRHVLLRRAGVEDVERERIWIFLRRVLHTAHHRAPLGVYLRMLDKTVPPVYGPTADLRWEGADPTSSVAAASRK